MKLTNIVLRRHRKQLVQQFGAARLVKLPNGQHELLGGSANDRAAAFEWVSLFAHEIVFTHFHHEANTRCRSRKILFPPRLQPAG